MKTSNYLAKLPQEATIKSIQVLKDYDLITLDVPTASQRLCPHCGSNDCVIKDSGTLQTISTSPVIIAVPSSPSTSAGSCARTVTPLSMRLPTGSIPPCV